MINYNDKRFKAVYNSNNGNVTPDTMFHYKQAGDIVTCTYDGRSVMKGHLIAIVRSDGSLDMRYHHIKRNGEIVIGICRSTPEVMENGKLRLREKWKWVSWDLSEGDCILEEL